MTVLRRTASYRARSEDEVNGLWTADHQRIRAAGWKQAGPARWAPGPQFVLHVDYEYLPPKKVRRWIWTEANELDDVFAADARRMSAAGYIPEEQRWHGPTHQGWALVVFGLDQKQWWGRGQLEIFYSYRPDLAGPPTTSMPPIPGERAASWGAHSTRRRHPPLRHRRTRGLRTP